MTEKQTALGLLLTLQDSIKGDQIWIWMPRPLFAFRACRLRKERLETEQLEQLEAGVFSAGAKHRPVWHQCSRKEEIHPAFYMHCSTFPLLGAGAEVTGLRSCTWNSSGDRTRTKTGYFQHSHKSTAATSELTVCWSSCFVPPPSTENKPSVSSWGGVHGKKNIVSQLVYEHFDFTFSQVWKKYVATPVSRGLNTKTQREQM